MGFCLFNNIAIGAKEAIAVHGLDRVLVVDWDVHHGNGTQDMFWTDEQVGFISIHRWPFYPGTGDSDETGSGKGLGYTRNLPIEYGTSRSDYLSHFETELADFAAPTWVRVEPADRDGSLIELSGEGRHIAVGRFVRPELRPALADELRAALRRSTSSAIA